MCYYILSDTGYYKIATVIDYWEEKSIQYSLSSNSTQDVWQCQTDISNLINEYKIYFNNQRYAA